MVVEKLNHLDYTLQTRLNTQVAIIAAGTPSMPKILSVFGLAVSAVLLVLFSMDLAMGFPFDGQSPLMDIGFLICTAGLGYLSWNAFREQF